MVFLSKFQFYDCGKLWVAHSTRALTPDRNKIKLEYYSDKAVLGKPVLHPNLATKIKTFSFMYLYLRGRYRSTRFLRLLIGKVTSLEMTRVEIMVEIILCGKVRNTLVMFLNFCLCHFEASTPFHFKTLYFN